MTRDGYHNLNLLEKVTQNGSTVANYSYLSEGTKLSSANSSGVGFVYRGSLVYGKNGSTLSLESSAFGGGRLIAASGSSTPNYYVTDHLGSVRVVLNNSGDIVSQHDYYPFGKSHDNSNLQTSPNRYLFNGKESQMFANVPYLDYGARMYDADVLPWLTQDPLLQNYLRISPYAFCAGNPVRCVDPDGREIDNYTAMLDGTIQVERTDDSFDKFSVETTSGAIKELAKLEKHVTDSGATLVKFPEQGSGFFRYGEADEGGDRFLQPTTAAALFGAINATNEQDNTINVQLGDMSAADGGKPGTAHQGGSTSHVNGRNVDVRYIRSDRMQAPVTVFDTAFDVTANQAMVNNFHRYGFTSILSHTNNTGELLQNTKSWPKHHNHLHLQGFMPKIKSK